MSRRKQPNPNKVNPVMENEEQDMTLEESPDPEPLNHLDLLNSEEKLTNGGAETPMETDQELGPESGLESRPESRPEGDLSSINEMMSAVMSSAVMSSSNINGTEEEAESASSSTVPSPSPSPTKALTSAMRAPPSRNQRRTQDSKDDSSAFICPLCDKNCQTQHQLTMHIRQHNADAGATDHSCSICGKCLSSASSLDRHMLVHSGERPYKCSVCGQTFTTNGNMHRHMKIHEKDPASGLVLLSPPSPSPSKRRRPPSVKRRLTEEEEPPLKKPVEEAMVEDSVAPIRSMEEELSCPICFTTLSSRHELDEHMDTHPDTALRCDTCCLTFRTHRGLLRHNAGVHQLLPLDPSGRPFIQSNPSIPSGFNELAFIDFSCSKFSHIAQVWCETNLRRCLSKFHRFVCDLCDRAFPLRSALDLHKTRTHRPSTDQAPETDPDKASVQAQDREESQDESEQEGFLETLGLKLKSKVPAGPSESDLIQARLDSIKSIPVDSSSVHMEALSLGLSLGVPLFQTSFLLQSEGGAMGSEAPPLMELADLQHILQVAAAAPNQIALSMKGGATGSAQRPPLKPRPQPASRCGLASTPPPPQPASLGCISPSLPPPTPLFKSLRPPEESPPSVSPPSESPPLPHGAALPHTSLSPDEAIRKPRPQPKGSLCCRFCAQTFPHSALLQSHLRSHLGVVPHQCNICEYVAPDKATLIRHLRTHSGERPYVCRVCHYPFTVKANCERHLRKKHNKSSRKDIEKNIKYVTSSSTNNITAALSAAAAGAKAQAQAEDADTVCRFCGDDLKSYRSLQIHLRAHSGCQRKPFECRRCGAAFLAKRNCIHHLLKQHPEVQEREIDEHIHTLQPVSGNTNHILQPANATANVANTALSPTVPLSSTRLLNGLSLKPDPGLPSDMGLDQPLDFSAKSRGGSMKAELSDTVASDEPIDLSVSNKRQRRLEPEIKQERDEKATPVLACFVPPSSSNPTSSCLSPASSSVRQARLKPLLPKPAASDLPPLASIAQIISSVSTATDLLRREAVATTTGAAGGATEGKVEPERETTPEDEDPARKRPRKKTVSKAAVELESSADFASVEKMLANTDANKFSPYLQSVRSTQNTTTSPSTSANAPLGTHQSAGSDSTTAKRDGTEEKTSPRDEVKPLAPKGKKNAYSNSAQKMTCPFCPRVFPWASSLQRHMLTHTGQKPFPCPKCDAFFSTKSNCERHLLRKHGVTNRTLRRNGAVTKKEEEASHESAGSQSEAEPVQTETDPKTSESHPAATTAPVQSEPLEEVPTSGKPAHNPEPDPVSSEATQSEASESSPEVPEDIGEKQTETSSNASKVESVDDDDDCHSNKSLDLNFGRKLIDFKLSATPSSSSPDEQPATNSANDANCTNDSDFSTSKHICVVCSKSFCSTTTLAQHEKLHEEEGRVPSAGEEEESKEHMESMVRAGEASDGDSGESDLEEQDEEEEGEDDSGEEPRSGEGRSLAEGGGRVDKRKKICNVCGKRFWSLQDLTRHMRSHTGERPYQCSTCERTFTLKHSLVRHQRIHLKPRSGEDPCESASEATNEEKDEPRQAEERAKDRAETEAQSQTTEADGKAVSEEAMETRKPQDEKETDPSVETSEARAEVQGELSGIKSTPGAQDQARAEADPDQAEADPDQAHVAVDQAQTAPDNAQSQTVPNQDQAAPAQAPAHADPDQAQAAPDQDQTQTAPAQVEGPEAGAPNEVTPPAAEPPAEAE